MKITCYLDIISSWCHWAEPAWAELKRRYGGQVEFDWKIALMDADGMPVSAAQLEWFYRRSGTLMNAACPLNSGWHEPGLAEYLAPNAVAEAARDLGVLDDSVRIALAHAAVKDGKRVGDWQVSAAIASQVSGIEERALMTLARSPSIEARLRATTREFHAFGITQRPAFVLENALGDRVVFSGIVSLPPLAAALDAMLQDETAAQAYAAEHGSPPAA